MVIAGISGAFEELDRPDIAILCRAELYTQLQRAGIPMRDRCGNGVVVPQRVFGRRLGQWRPQGDHYMARIEQGRIQGQVTDPIDFYNVESSGLTIDSHAGWVFSIQQAHLQGDGIVINNRQKFRAVHLISMECRQVMDHVEGNGGSVVQVVGELSRIPNFDVFKHVSNRCNPELV